MTNINNLTDVDGADVVDMSREAFENWYRGRMDIFTSFKIDEDGYYEDSAEQIAWKAWQACEQSKQAEIDQLRAELEKVIMDSKLHQLRAEDADAFEMWLDDHFAPKYSHEEVNYSLIGRTMRLLVKLTKTD
jgi:hypothetical protein